MARRIWSLTCKEFHQLRRDPVLMILIAWLFTVEVLLCAYALSFDLNDAPIAVEDLDGTPASRSLVDRLERCPDFRVAAHATGDRSLEPLLDRNEAVAVVRIPPGWSRALHRGSGAEVQLLVDGANSGTAATVRGYLQAMIYRHGLELANPAGDLPGLYPLVESRTRVWFNSELKTVYFMVLSMIALSAMLVGVIHPAASLVQEREGGTLEQLLVSPMRPGELVLAKLLVTLAASLAGLTASLGLVWWFEVPVRGSLALFYLVSAVFQVSSIGLGILVATLSKNLQQALLLAFFGLLPVMFLSGTMMPIESMPRPVQVASLLSPLRYYIDCLLGLFLRGNGLAVLCPRIAAMAALGSLVLAGSLLRLRRHLV